MYALRETRYGEGDTTSPMRAALAANAVNIALDAFFVLGLGWGVSGAAFAAVCGNAVALAVLAWPMRRRIVAPALAGRRRARALAAGHAVRPPVRDGGRVVPDPDRDRRAHVVGRRRRPRDGPPRHQRLVPARVRGRRGRVDPGRARGRRRPVRPGARGRARAVAIGAGLRADVRRAARPARRRDRPRAWPAATSTLAATRGGADPRRPAVHGRRRGQRHRARASCAASATSASPRSSGS